MVLPPSKPGTAPASGVAAPMAAKPAASPPGPPAAATAAAASVPAFGGNRGGKARKDGLVPGTSAAAAADRAKERERKRIAREDAARLAQPPPLPSATAPGEAATAPVAGAAEPGAVRLVAAPVLPWQPETLKNLFEQLLEAAEEGRVAAFLGKCAEAKLTAELVREIKADAHFPKAAKVLLADALPRLAAKWLNRSGMSAEYQDEISCLTAMVLIVQHDRGISSKLDELIAAAKKPVEPEKKTG